MELGLEVDDRPERGRRDGALAEELQRWLLAALYPFADGTSFDVLARALAPLGCRRADLAEVLAGMAASSLVSTKGADGTARYQVPEAGRANLGGQRWLASRLHGTARQHVAWCKELVSGADEALSCGPGQKRWLERLAPEQANLGAVLRFALRSGDTATAALVASELCAFWELRGPLQETRLLISEVLGAGAMPVGARARQGRRDHEEQLAVQALGAFQVLRSGKPVNLPPQVARLVKLVVVGHGQVHVEQAVESLWAEVPPKIGKRRLRNVLSKLSSHAGPLVVREGEVLRLGPRVTVDAYRFEAAAREALSALNGARGTDAIADALAAHGLYVGELLPEDRYEDFAIVARERLRWLHLRLLDTAGAAAAKAHDGATVERCLRAALEIDPTDEGRYLALARYLLSSGRPSAANHVLAMARELLSRLELPVTPALLRLDQALRAHAERASAPLPPVSGAPEGELAAHADLATAHPWGATLAEASAGRASEPRNLVGPVPGGQRG